MANEQIKKSEVRNLIEQGFKKDQLAAHFGIPKSRVAKILQTFNLRIKSTRGAGYVLIDDEETEGTIVTPLLQEPEKDVRPENYSSGQSKIWSTDTNYGI